MGAGWLVVTVGVQGAGAVDDKAHRHLAGPPVLSVQQSALEVVPLSTVCQTRVIIPQREDGIFKFSCVAKPARSSDCGIM